MAIDPCDGHTSNCRDAVEADYHRQAMEEERMEEEREAAIDQWAEDMVTYVSDVVHQYAIDWALYALALKAGNHDVKEPVLLPAPVHPDLVPSEPVDPNAEIPT